MKKYQIISAFFISVAIISILSILNKAFYINKHIRINNAYIWAPLNRFRINREGYLIRIDVRELSVIKKGTKLAYVKLKEPEFNRRILKIIENEQKRELSRINSMTVKFDYALKENSIRLNELTNKLNLISDYLSKLVVKNEQDGKKALKISDVLLSFYKAELKKEEAVQQKLKRLYKKGLISYLRSKSEDAKIENIRKIIKKLKLKNFKNISTEIQKISVSNSVASENKAKNKTGKPEISASKKETAETENQPERYSYIISDTSGIVYKILVPVPSEVYPRDTLFSFYKPEKMRVVAYYAQTSDISKGADVIITAEGKKIKGKIEEIYYNSSAINGNSAIKLVIKPDGDITKYPLYTPVRVDVKQSKWF